MPISEAHKRANAKWDQANLMTLGVRLKRTDAMAFKEYAASQGKTANALLKEYVLKCLYPEDDPQPLLTNVICPVRHSFRTA